MAKNYSGVAIGPARSIKDRDMRREIHRIWNSIQPLDHWARGASQGFGRISHGQVPDGSGTMISSMITLDSDLTAIAALTGTGVAARTADNTWALRTLTAGTGLSISNPAGVGGDPLISLDQDLIDIAGITRTQGDLIVGGASAWVDLAVGANGTILTVSAGTPTWSLSSSMTDPLDLTERATPTPPSQDVGRVFTRAIGGAIQFVFQSSTGEECIPCTLNDTTHVNTLLFNGIEP